MTVFQKGNGYPKNIKGKYRYFERPVQQVQSCTNNCIDIFAKYRQLLADISGFANAPAQLFNVVLIRTITLSCREVRSRIKAAKKKNVFNKTTKLCRFFYANLCIYIYIVQNQ